MDFKRYFNNEELETVLKEWADTYPALAALAALGASYEGKPIWLLTLTNQETGPAGEKPAVWLDGNLHATELAGSTTSLYIAYHLLDGYGKNETITRLLDTSTFYIVPRLNPDGAELAMAKNPRYIRSGVRPYPWQEMAEGLHPQDIDGDGLILQMRVVDPNGDWKVSSLDSRLLEKRRPDETGGTYYRLFTEGLVHNYDGYLIKHARPLQGLDFNRNYPFQWRPEGEETGAGPFPTSEPETRAQVEFMSTHRNINVAISFHTFSRVILRPYSTKSDDDMETDDVWVFRKLGEIGKELTGYRSVSTFHDFKYHPKEVTTGAFDDWLYDHLGAFSFTIELWDLPTRAGIVDRKFIEWFREHPHEEDLKILQWIDENGGENSYVDWRPFEHPQLGAVELGGWNQIYTWRNPPHAFMEEEASLHLPFVIALGNMLPLLTVHTLEVKRLGGDSYHLNLVVENSGFFPTYTSQQGKKRKAVRPVRVELELPEGVSLSSGKIHSELGHLEGRSNNLDVTSLWSSSPTDNRERGEWILHGPAGSPVTLKIISERAGVLHREIILG